MRNILYLLFVLSAFVSCKKDKPEGSKQETIAINPMKEIAAMDPANNTSDGSPGNYQVGVRFLTYKEGTISKLGLRSPSAGNYRVQLYTFISDDSTSLNYPLVAAPQRLGYADITINASAAAAGTVVWGNISSVKLMPWNSDGPGKIRQYGVCYNDQDMKQYQVSLPAGVSLPLRYNNSLSLLRYSFSLADDQNSSAWTSIGGGFGNLVYGGEQFEFVTAK